MSGTLACGGLLLLEWSPATPHTPSASDFKCPQASAAGASLCSPAHGRPVWRACTLLWAGLLS